MELNIFNSILFGTLRPWLMDFTNQREISAALKPSNTNPANKFTELQNQILAILSVQPDFKIWKASLNSSIDIEIQPYLYHITLANFSNIPTKYYHHIITKEAQRVSTLLHYNTSSQKDESIIAYDVRKFLKSIKSLLKEITRLSNGTQPVTIAPLSYYTLQTLRQSLLVLFFDTQERHKHLLKEVETEESIIINALNETYSGRNELKSTVHYYIWHTSKLVTASQFSEENILFLLKEINSAKSEDLLQLQAALENLIFIERNNVAVKYRTIEGLTDHNFIEHTLSNSLGNITNILESANGLSPIDKITNAMEELSYIDSSCSNNQSVPQRFYKWLKAKHNYLNNKTLESSLQDNASFNDNNIPAAVDECYSFTYINYDTNPGKLQSNMFGYSLTITV